jgi:hypothetical protein
VANQLDHYFDMSNLQSQLVKKALKEDIVVIKKKIFPKLAIELQKISKDVEILTPFTLESVSAHEAQFKAIFKDGLTIIEPSVVEFAQRLQPEQLDSFKKEFEKKSRDIQKEAMDPVEARDKRFDKMRKYFEGWIGKMTNEQRSDLRKFAQLNIFPYKEQLINREKISKEFIQSFSDLEKRKQFVSNFVYHYESMRDPAYTKAILEDQKNMFELVATVVNKMNADQRKYLLETLKDRVEQLNDSAKGKKRGLFD